MLTAAAWLLGSVLWVDLPHSHPYAANVRNAQPSAAAVVNDPNKSSSKRKQSGAAHERPAPVAASARALKARAKTGAAIAEVAPPHNGSAASNGRVDPQRLLRKFPFPLDPPDTLDPNADGRTVRHLCGAGNVEHVIFVHTDPTHRRERNLFRATVGHPRVASLLKWSVLFLVGLRPGFNVTDEAAKFGDVVQLPFFDHYRNLSLKFLNGMRWVMLNCPAARSVVKVDDDVFLHPEVLSAYLRTQLRPGDRRLHCAAYRGNAVIRNPHSRHYLSVHDYPAKHFPTHCRGLLVIIPAPVMWDLYVAAFRLPVHAIDDAYVTGDLAKAASLGHRDITRMLWAEDDKLLEVLRGEYMCAFFTGRSKLAVRANLWKTLSHIKKRRDLDEAMQSTLVNFR
ncbi:acetylgalactosaminyl-O-glycosyl-glycoprotein beta-1,3-N-acetylglucosaminyltransferase-like [Haemaphysalis longicornis]